MPSSKAAKEIWQDESNNDTHKDVTARWTLKIGEKTRYRLTG